MIYKTQMQRKQGGYTNVFTTQQHN